LTLHWQCIPDNELPKVVVLYARLSLIIAPRMLIVLKIILTRLHDWTLYW